MNEAEARVERIQREIARREAAKSTSERQAAYLTGRGRETNEDDDDEEVMPGRRISSKPRRRVVEDQGDASARIQARQIIAGPRRLPSRSWTSEEES